MRKTGKSLKRLALLLVLSMILAGIAPAVQAEAAGLYKKFPTYTRYENKYGKAGMTADNGALERLLAAKTYVYVYLRNVKTAETYTIPANSKFAEKRLRVNAPLSKVVNHASSMKVVKITEVENWTEYGKGNSFAVVDENAKFEVGTGSTVDKLYFQADNGKVDLDVKGDVKKTGFYGDKMDAEVTISQGTTQEFRVAAENSKVDVTVEKTAEVNTVKVVKDADVTLNVNDGVEKVVLDAPANVTITGDSEKVKEVAVEIGGKAEGAKVTSDVPVKAEVEAKADITLKEGAEGSTVKKADEKVEVAVKNDTKEDVTVSTEGTTKTETVPSTNQGTTGGGTTGGGTTGGSTGGGTTVVDPGNGGGNIPGGGDTPNPPVTPTVTPAAITTISVTAVGITGDAISFTRTGGTNEANLTVTSATENTNVTVKLYDKDKNEVTATAVLGTDGESVNLASIPFTKVPDIRTITITETETQAKTTLKISVAKEGGAPAQEITTNISGFTVTATNISETATVTGPTLAGENGKYNATAAVTVTNASTTVTVTIDIPEATSIGAITDITNGGSTLITPSEKTFTIDLTSNVETSVTKTITIQEANGGATTTLTITVTVEETEEPPVVNPPTPVVGTSITAITVSAAGIEGTKTGPVNNEYTVNLDLSSKAGELENSFPVEIMLTGVTGGSVAVKIVMDQGAENTVNPGAIGGETIACKFLQMVSKSNVITAEGTTLTVTLTEAREGAEPIVTKIEITVKATEETEKPAPENKNVTAEPYEEVGFDENGYAYAKYEITDVTKAAIYEVTAASINTDLVEITDGGICVTVTTASATPATVTLAAVGTANTITITLTTPDVEGAIKKVRGLADGTTIESTVVEKYTHTYDDSRFFTYGVFSSSGSKVDFSDKELRKQEVTAGGIKASNSIVAVLATPAYQADAEDANNVTGPSAKAVYYTINDKLYRWWDEETNDETDSNTNATDGSVVYHDIMLNLGSDFNNSTFYIVEFADSNDTTGKIYKAVISEATDKTDARKE